ncbi:helicase HerA-like domain-containing protein [Gulosibacter sediminis]|uniref:helicase HerA-like domain-containing protein n=1 Tax=Gulosibacter sediminis TaxID=1729695 RepID=UPI0024A90670|nr:helicase HerA-like domain-containing protein [Gulosibacter sediminis]
MSNDSVDPVAAAREAVEKAQAELAAAEAAAKQAAESAAIDAAAPAPEESSEAATAEPSAGETADAASDEPATTPAPDAAAESPEPEAQKEPAAAKPGAAGGPLAEGDVEAIRSGYSFDAPALELGALVNGEVDAAVPVRIPLAMTNRHGLVAGATGTGKTKTLQVMLEQLSAAGVPVFAADIKGDLSGVATEGTASDGLLARTKSIGQDWQPTAFPSEFYSLGGRGTGVPIRATVSSFGPLMLAKVLGLNETQESSLGLVFHFADQQGLPLVNLDDVRSLLQYLTSDLGKSELEGIGGVSKQTAGVILRELTNFAANGADVFFGEPEIDTAEFLRTAADGRGIVSLLELPGVAQQPQLFSTFLMWLLADLFSALPEVGDLDKPKLVFFFDEAHLLFADASKEFVSQIVQTVRLIRSKGVGIFFVTQTPKDVPDDVLAQLGSRVQHQLRAHTPNDAKSLRATVRTYPNSGYDLEQVLTQLATGEAIVTVMNEKGAPSPVAWTRMRAPQGSMDPTPAAQIESTVNASPLLAKYGTAVDPESAHEILTAKMNAAAEAERAEEEREAAEKERAREEKERAREEKERAREEKERAAAEKARNRQSTTTRTSSRREKSVVEEVLGSRAAQSAVKEVVRSVFGTLMKKR